MQFELDESCGRCDVMGVPLAAFTDWKTGTVDVMALAKVGTFVRRGAMQNGFQKVPISGVVPPGSGHPQVQGFLASCHLTLRCPTVSGHTIHAKEVVQGQVYWSAVGNSSYTTTTALCHSNPVEAKANTVKDGQHPQLGTTAAVDTNGRVLLGTNQVTIVRIDPSTRKPTGLTDEFKAYASERIGQSAQELSTLGVNPKMARLALPNCAKAALTSLLAAGVEEAKDVGGERGNSSTAGVLLARERFIVRYSDTDFNGHLNQSLYISFAIDSTRQWLAQHHEQPNPALGTDIAQVRIDFLSEVRDVGSPLECFLFATEPSSVQGVNEEGEKKEESDGKVWFAIVHYKQQGEEGEGERGARLMTSGVMVAQGFVVLQEESKKLLDDETKRVLFRNDRSKDYR